jgi:hypothetical protein
MVLGSEDGLRQGVLVKEGNGQFRCTHANIPAWFKDGFALIRVLMRLFVIF